MVNGRRNGAMMGKLMVGSLAGLMILEGLVEREQSQEEPAGRGLFALPVNLASILAPRVSLGVSTASFSLLCFLLPCCTIARLQIETEEEVTSSYPLDTRTVIGLTCRSTSQGMAHCNSNCLGSTTQFHLRACCLGLENT